MNQKEICTNQNRYLSVSSAHDDPPPTHNRSSSNTSSRTRFDPSDDEEESHARIRRRQTQIASVPLSYLDLIKGIFYGPKRLRQKLAAEMESRSTGVPEGKEYDERDCEYILNVTVWPRPPSEGLRQQVRCVLDTGCLQGNIISARLAQSLGFTTADYEALKHREKQGGMVATGHVHQVVGAVRVSWTHGGSTEVIRQMRFLVSENEHLDLIVGPRSIRKWNLVSPPNLNFGTVKSKVVAFNPKSDLKREALASAESTVASEVKDLERQLKRVSSKSTNHARLKTSIEKAKQKKKRAEEELRKYDAAKLASKDVSKS